MLTFWKIPEFDDTDEQCKVKYFVGQEEEAPSTKKRHFQCYCEFKHQMRMSEIKKYFNDNTVHIEPRKGNQKQAVEYCTKEDTRVEDGWSYEYGTKGQQGHRSDLDSLVDAMEAGLTSKEILGEFRGTALRYISHIEKGLKAIHKLSAIDNYILSDRRLKESMKNTVDASEVGGNTGRQPEANEKLLVEEILLEQSKKEQDLFLGYP